MAPHKRHDDGRSLLDRALRFLFLATVILAAFAIGWGAGAFKIYPHAILINTYKTAKTQIEWFTGKESVIGNIRFVDIAPDRVEAYRFEFVAARTLTDPILVTGGLEQFAEYCPGHVGCLAIEYDGGGNVVQAYPYRPEEIEKTPPLVGFLLRAAARVLDARRGASPVCVALRQW